MLYVHAVYKGWSVFPLLINFLIFNFIYYHHHHCCCCCSCCCCTYEHLSEWCSVMVGSPVSYLDYVCLNLDYESVLGYFLILCSPLKYWIGASQWTRRIFFQFSVRSQNRMICGVALFFGPFDNSFSWQCVVNQMMGSLVKQDLEGTWRESGME
jgi:hypothetical protein